ncbi:hypothetical protein LJZ24_004660 [Escherichia coli]|nr:hypothetical protein [Escherichia coli]
MKTIKYCIAALVMAFTFNVTAAPNEKLCEYAAVVTGMVGELVQLDAEVVAIDEDVNIGIGYYVKKGLKHGQLFAAQEREINSKKVVIAWAVTGALEAYRGNPDPAVTMYDFCMGMETGAFMKVSLRHYDNIMSKINSKDK